jgi:hypothetical protein
VDFNIPNYALIHWLTNTDGVWVEPSKLHVGNFNMVVAASCIIQKQQNVPVLHFHSAIESH